ncbi:putative membrane protein [Spongiibacter sp. IMCC21906]|uniref:Mpo1-like protein n=1 Tax=Spongiibacter sp. IMCC21906 TaxID=1620392 RepID=UPI00062DE8B1|nr:Mpo1-like protein [Spongiibacter sp. IMCC21906]AKH69037.1 putative membrane protein [Spongiibacter sp. IMCC21906]
MNNDNNQMTFNSFAEFYPYYLAEHQNLVCRRLHLIGSCLVIVVLLTAIFSGAWLLLMLLPLIGYGFAWVGHFFFEKNRPATFSHPLYSFIGDWVMAKDLLTGRLPL